MQDFRFYCSDHFIKYMMNAMIKVMSLTKYSYVYVGRVIGSLRANNEL